MTSCWDTDETNASGRNVTTVHRMCLSPTTVPSVGIGPSPTDSDHVDPDVREPSAPAYASKDEGLRGKGDLRKAALHHIQPCSVNSCIVLSHVVYVVPSLLNTHQINPNHHRAFIDIVVVHTSWTYS